MLDLMMPEFSGFELCQNLHSMSYTATIPIFIVTGEDGARHREHCQMLGAKGYFQKPVDFTVLKTALEDELRKKPPERRRAPRVRMRVGLRLCGIDATAKPFEEITATEDASATGFFCVCTAELTAGTRVEVFMTGAHARRAGVAEVVRADAPHTPRQKYGFRFVDEPQAWIFQS
jgi:response regulator RpfG family c-di-GMP phosphodiesterase